MIVIAGCPITAANVAIGSASLIFVVAFNLTRSCNTFISRVTTLRSAACWYSAAIVFAEDRFETLTHTEFKIAQKTNREKGRPTKSIEALGGKMPVIVFAQPFNKDEFAEYLEDIFNGGLELRERSDRYRLLSSLTDELDKFRIKDAPTTGDEGEGDVTEIPASSKPNVAGEVRFPLVGRFSDGEIVLDAKTYELVQIIRDE